MPNKSTKADDKNPMLIVIHLPEPKPNRIPNVDVYSVSPTIANTMLAVVHFLLRF
jgi:hypothetical protein